jgi:hypothetical protein
LFSFSFFVEVGIVLMPVLGFTGVLRNLGSEVLKNLSATCGKIAVLGFGI